MVNLFGFQPLNMQALLHFELLWDAWKYENFIPEKMLIYTCVEVSVGFIDVASTTARTSKFVYNTRHLRESGMKSSFGLKMLHSLNGEKIALTFKSLQYLLIIDEICFLV